MPSATPEPGNNKTNVIALGGNAILSDGDSGDVAQQMRSTELACRHLVPLFSFGNGVVITHGNGLQVDNLLVQQENAAPEIPQHLLDICVAMTQGQIGTHISNDCWTRFFVVRAFRGT